MESSTRIEEAAAEWLAKRDADRLTDADEAEFARWLNASTAHRVAFLRLDAAWQEANRLKALGAGAGPGVVPPPGEWRQHSPFFAQPLSLSEERASGDSEEPATRERDGSSPTASIDSAAHARAVGKPKRFARPFRGLAASVLIAAAIALGWYLLPGGPSYRTAVGGLAAVPMSDGSKVMLNTDSEIRVAVTDKERRVELEHGEAYFEVARDPVRPFVVQAGDQRVVAVGTRFSVRRDENGSGEVLVVVTEGRVRVEAAPRGLSSTVVPPAEVSAGGVARSGDTGVLIQQKPVADAEVMLSWRSGYLVFRDTLLADAVAEFNRYNDRKIVIKDAAVAGIRIGGNFRSTNAEAFVRLLEDGFPIRAEQGDRERIVLTAI